MKPTLVTFAVLLAASNAALPAAAPAVPNTQAIAEVAAGKRTAARASWWGFDPADSTAALQAAINSGARKLIVEDMGAPWITGKLTLASDLEIVFEKGVIVQAKRGAFRGGVIACSLPARADRRQAGAQAEVASRRRTLHEQRGRQCASASAAVSRRLEIAGRLSRRRRGLQRAPWPPGPRGCARSARLP